MSKKTDYLKKLLEVQNSHQQMMNQIVVDAIREQEGLVHRLFEEENNFELTLGQKVADKIATFGGSWYFISLFAIFLIIWMCVSNFMGTMSFDPFPYILLNLILSCLAAIQAPVILMSQNRKEARESRRSENDYLVNLKTELENRAMDHKLDLLINEQFKELIEIQKIQINQLDKIENAVLKKSKAST